MTDRLDAMRCFAAVCEAGGFSAASRRLDRSVSAVTRAVSGLERGLGVRLLERSTRAVRLTEAGEEYLGPAVEALALLDAAERAAAGRAVTVSGRLRLAAPLVFGRLHAGRVVARFMAVHPEVRVELLLGNRHLQVVPEGVDVAVRIGSLPDSGLAVRGLGHTGVVLAASPAYLARQGMPRSPSALAGHRLLAFEGVARRRSWAFRDGSIAVDPALYSDNAEAAIAVAEAGGGIVSALRYQVAGAFASGTLVAVLSDAMPPPVPVQAVFPAGRQMTAAVRAMLDLLVAEAGAWTG